MNSALSEEMRSDTEVVVLGQDVGMAGGVFRATEGLYNEFGPERVMDTTLSESAIVGVSIGLALYGFKPVAEIQFLDFIYPAFDQIVSELAKIRYRSGGEYQAPVVIRSPSGGGIKGGLYHSQSSEAFFAHVPGLQVVIPSTPSDAKGLLKSSIRGKDPVIFLEPKRLYRSVRGEVQEEDYAVPIGKARIASEGSDVSILGYGSVIPTILEASAKAEDEGISVEVVDIRTLVPLDVEAILSSVRKTGRALVVYEAPKIMGYGAEIAAIIAEEAIDYLQAPVARVGGFDTPFPYVHEKLYMPTTRRILGAIRKAARH